MTFFQWTEDFSVGIEQMDLQHKKLIAIINAFHESLEQGNDEQAIYETIEKLKNYIPIHFADEEELMQKYDYPQFELHKRLHDRLAQDVNELSIKVETGQKVVNLEMALFLKGWLENHIGQTDKKYGTFINSRQKQNT